MMYSQVVRQGVFNRIAALFVSRHFRLPIRIRFHNSGPAERGGDHTVRYDGQQLRGDAAPH